MSADVTELPTVNYANTTWTMDPGMRGCPWSTKVTWKGAQHTLLVWKNHADNWLWRIHLGPESNSFARNDRNAMRKAMKWVRSDCPNSWLPGDVP